MALEMFLSGFFFTFGVIGAVSIVFLLVVLVFYILGR